MVRYAPANHPAISLYTDQVYAQSSPLRGQVTVKNGSPAEGAYVLHQHYDEHAHTDALGTAAQPITPGAPFAVREGGR